MSLINIKRDNTDMFYRYKMPPIQSKIEGRGNGIKTNVVNAADVARALSRPPSYVMKYFGLELGAQTSINDEKEKYLVNGQHDAAKLQDVLDGFISKFVLCPSCQNPETVIVVTKDQNLTRDCKACGQITKIDPRLKLVTYILKNPPKKMSKKSATASENVVGGGVSIADIAQKQAGGEESSEAAATSDNAPPPSQKVEVRDDEWAVDMSEEAIKQRAKELEGLTISADDKFEEFGEWLLSFSEGELPSDVDIFKKASDLQIVKDRKTVEVLAQCIFDENVVAQIKQHKGLLGKLLISEKHEKSLLGGLERLIGLQKKDMIKSVPKILMTLYDAELISEEVIMDWGTHVSKKYVPKDVSKKVRKAAGPFLDWLKEAEEEDDEEDDDEDDE